MEYIAFISYRHLPLSSEVAEKLASQIEQFVIPKRLRKNGERRLGRVFRDRDELPLSSNLADDLYRALDESEYLIVICSPELQESRYCMEEIRYFLEKHDRNHVLTVLASGAPNESFPQVLLTEIDSETGKERHVEPLAADIVAGTTQESLKKLKKEKLRLIAPMLGCKYDELAKRMKRRRRRKALTAAAVFCALAVALTFFAVRMNRKNLAEREARIRQEAQLSAEQSRAYLEQGLQKEALSAAVAAFPQMPDGTMLVTPEGIRALSNAGHFYETGTLVPCGTIEPGENVYSAELSADGRKVTVNGKTYDAETLKLLPDEPKETTWQAPEGENTVLQDEENDRIVLDTGAEFVIRRLSDGEKLGTSEHEKGRTVEAFTVTGDGKYSFVLHISERDPLFEGLYDAVGKSRTNAVIDAFGPDGSVTSFDVPFDENALLLPVRCYIIYACKDGLYAIDPDCFISDHRQDEAFFYYSFAEEGMNTEMILALAGKNAVLLFTGDSIWGFDGDTGLTNNRISLQQSDVLGKVCACAWTREDESAAVFITETGQVWHYYDEHPGLSAVNLTPFMQGRYSDIVNQNTEIRRMDRADSANEGPVRFAAVSADEPQVVRLYAYQKNERGEYISINRDLISPMDMDMAPGYLLLYEGKKEDDQYHYKLLYRGEGEPWEKLFSIPSSSWGVVGISDDAKQAYCYFSVMDLETAEVQHLFSKETGQFLNTRRNNISLCNRDSRGETLRMAVAQGTPDSDTIMFVSIIRNDAVTWESAFPLEADAFFDSIIGDRTAIGKNGWAITPVKKTDGSFAAVLTDLYGERFTILDEDIGYDWFAMGINPDKPVMALLGDETLRICSCTDGKVMAEYPMPFPADSLKNMCFVQDDRYIFLAQQDLTTVVIDAADGKVLFRMALPEARKGSVHLLPVHVYEKEGEITVCFRNEGYSLYTAGYSISTESWQVIREIPRLYRVDYTAGYAVVLDPTLTRCYMIPLLTTGEMLAAVSAAE